MRREGRKERSDGYEVIPQGVREVVEEGKNERSVGDWSKG